ncbi:hypothetical protein [Fischerella sp. JS2]|uniref:hypothetical protein n=1 Tax=Fischerella sp. JS2 TaxID=2597771 RepID=UPI0028E435F7|nr:hypothetical protein [Fischerella sp. JS2]
MLPVIEVLIYDIHGNPHNVSVGVDSVSVLDDGLEDDDYTDAEEVQVVLSNGDSFVCNPWDDKNRGQKDTIWDMFLCM